MKKNKSPKIIFHNLIHLIYKTIQNYKFHHIFLKNTKIQSNSYKNERYIYIF